MSHERSGYTIEGKPVHLNTEAAMVLDSGERVRNSPGGSGNAQ